MRQKSADDSQLCKMSAHVSLCSLPCFIICFSHLQDLPSDFVLSVPRERRLIAKDEAQVQNDLIRFSERQPVNEYSNL
jgi:hypothetical protein